MGTLSLYGNLAPLKDQDQVPGRRPMLSRLATWIIERKHGITILPTTELHENLERLRVLSRKIPQYPVMRRAEDLAKYHEFTLEAGTGRTKDLFTERGAVSVAHTILDGHTEFPMHSHKEQEIIVVVTGSLLLSTEQSTQLLLPGGSAMLKPGENHSAVSPAGCSFVCITIPDSPDFPIEEKYDTPMGCD